MKTNTIFKLLVVVAIATVFAACRDNTVPESTTQKVNKFIFDGMDDVYLWYNKMPDIDYKNEPDSKEYFNKLLYEKDKWSFITDDVDALENSFQGIEKSVGWSLAFYYLRDGSNEVIAIVEYVYPHTPAANAGIKRGDIIISVNGSTLNDTNYSDLLYEESFTLTIGTISVNENDEVIVNQGSTYNLLALELNLNPVLKSTIVEHEGVKIGYLFYAQFINNYNSSLDTAFQNFIDQGINNVVLDLRYNPGGNVEAAQHLCSSLAPASVVDDESVLVRFEWNDKYQDYWVSKQIVSQIQVVFDKNVTAKMNLNHLYVLTGSGTASASELTITGLRPYMQVTTVGDTTYGKYTASITLKPEDLYSESYAADINNWGLQPIVIRYANTWGQTDFEDGFAPDIPVEEHLSAAFPLGDKNDPLLAAAIQDITGYPVVSATKSAKPFLPDLKLLDRGFSKFDRSKRELQLNNEQQLLFKQINTER